MLRLRFGNLLHLCQEYQYHITKIITVLTEIACVYPISAHRRGCTLKCYDQSPLSRKLVLLVIYGMSAGGRNEHGIKVACHLQLQTGQFTACVQTCVDW